MNHTPGPWEILDNIESLYIYIISPSTHKTVASIRRGSEIVLANADLIAAAPDLLAALEAMLTQWELWQFDSNQGLEGFDSDTNYSPTDRALMDQARAAIARAKGTHEVSLP